ncbi:hypothetical protein ACFRU3_45185 [Streptomyces sp. NPDC056910]|uniref:hypothetical protein n=1 Tax=Streptomyces sp. NPDC056910 TaxID=3345964 RepID=UPI0036ADD06F
MRAEETAAVRPVAASAARQGALVAMASVAVTVRHSRPVRIPVRVSLHRAAGHQLRTGCALACRRLRNDSRMVAQGDPIVHCAAAAGDPAHGEPQGA